MASAPESTPPAFALLIGINDYSAFDPTNGTNLAAGLYDVAAWYRMCVRRGIDPRNIHVLTTPLLTPETLPGGQALGAGHLAEATLSNIQTELAWLVKSLGDASAAGQTPVGLFTYSGHGDMAGKHLAICPSDAKRGAGPDPEGLISFRDFQKQVRAVPGVEANLTVVLDCCHSAAKGASGLGGTAPPMGTLSGRSFEEGKHKPIVVCDRVFMAAQPGELAYQATFDGHPHGAMTWAFGVVTDQYLVGGDTETDGFTLTHYALKRRAQKLLKALNIKQRLRMFGPKKNRRLYFLESGAAHAKTRDTAPTSARHGVQLDPNAYQWTVYKVSALDAANAELAVTKVLSVNGTAVGTSPVYSADTEYWHTPAAFLTSYASAAKLKFEALHYGDPVTSPASPPTTTQFSTWDSNKGPSMSGEPTWSEWANNPPAGTFFEATDKFAFRIAGTTPTTATIHWYRLAAKNGTPTGYLVSDATTPVLDKTTITKARTEAWYKPSGQSG